MSKSRILLLTAVLLPLVLTPAYMVWRDMQAFDDFEHYFESVAAVMDASAEKNEIEKNPHYPQGVENLNREMAASMEKIYESYGRIGDGNIDTGIILTRSLFDEIFRLRMEFAAVARPFLSERMQARKTVKDKESYEWRMGVLDGIHSYAAGYHTRLEQIVERFRQAVAGSNLPEKYKQYVWQHWGRGLNSRVAELGPDVAGFESNVTDYRRLFTYLYKYPDIYYVDKNDRIVISNNRYQKEYQSITKAVGQGW